MATSAYPELNERACGWLKFLWDKATTPDDWSSTGKPHEWWDSYSNYPTLSFPRFDLSNSAYALPVMADCTPAWREIYTRIADELVARHTTFWAAVDWLTQIGDDPDRANYSPYILEHFIPEHLRGKYDTPGWTANGVEPWGLQRDPIGSDGMLFFRGFFNLVLSVYAYVSGDDKWQRPFPVTGYQDQKFEWTHRGIAEFTSNQWKERPEGPHCENTKIWPYCLSLAGLGLKLFDGVSGKSTHSVFDEWLVYARKHYMSVSKHGKLEWFCRYYDPMINYMHKGTATTALHTACFVLPQNREFATFLYEAAMLENGWNDPKRPIGEHDPRFITIGLLLARELGDSMTEARLRDYTENQYQPKFFGKDADRFGWWFKLDERYPRGQWSGVMIVPEVGDPGSWARTYNQPNLDKFHEPTVEGVEFPALGISQAWNDKEHGALVVKTFAAQARRGAETSFKVVQLPDPDAVVVRCNGAEFTAWQVTGEGEILIRTTIDSHSFHIFTGYHGATNKREDARNENGTRARIPRLVQPRRSVDVRAKAIRQANRRVVSQRYACPRCTIG